MNVWRGNIEAHQQMPARWIGRTSFTIKPEYIQTTHNMQLANVCNNTQLHGQEIALYTHRGRA